MEHKIVDYNLVKNTFGYIMYGTCTEIMRFTYDKIKQGTLPPNIKMFDVTSKDGEHAYSIVAYDKDINDEFMGTIMMDVSVEFHAPVILDDFEHALYMLTTPGDQKSEQNGMISKLLEGGVIPYVQETLDDGRIVEHPLSINDIEDLADIED